MSLHEAKYVTAPVRLTPLQVAEIAERASKATGGEWRAEGTRIYATVDRPTTSVQDRHRGEVAVATRADPLYRYKAEATADFIAHSRQDIPALLADRAALVEENERLKATTRRMPWFDEARLEGEQAARGEIAATITSLRARLAAMVKVVEAARYVRENCAEPHGSCGDDCIERLDATLAALDATEKEGE